MADNNQQNKGAAPAEEQDVGRLRQVRRDKLKELQDAGKDPFQIVKYDQTHHTQEIRDNVEKLETVLEV
jgi:lysyl-tRNA synthetase class 2